MIGQRKLAQLRRLLCSMNRAEAATSSEYALLLAFLAVVLVVAVRFYGQAVVGLFQTYPELISS